MTRYKTALWTFYVSKRLLKFEGYLYELSHSLAIAVTGTIESDGLSGVFVNVALVEASGSACVDQYFTVFSGSRTNSSNSTLGSFPVDLCSLPVVNDVMVGASRSGLDGPTTVTSAFTANTDGKFSRIVIIYSPSCPSL